MPALYESDFEEVDSVEALAWLETADVKERTLSKDSKTFLNSQEARRLVRELYAAGATMIWAQRVTVEYEFEDASGLTVMLPKDQKMRAALFALKARALREMGSRRDPQCDQGQDGFVLDW